MASMKFVFEIKPFAVKGKKVQYYVNLTNMAMPHLSIPCCRLLTRKHNALKNIEAVRKAIQNAEVIDKTVK